MLMGALVVVGAVCIVIVLAALLDALLAWANGWEEEDL